MAKMEPCCAKFATQIRRAVADRNAAARTAVRLGTPRSREKLVEAKVMLARTERYSEDHTADHAGLMPGVRTPDRDRNQQPPPREEVLISKQRREREKQIDDEAFAMKNSIRRCKTADVEMRIGDYIIERRVQDKILDRLVVLGALGPARSH